MLVVDGVEMVDVREAAILVRRTPETVRRWVWSGRLTARRHGNRLLLRRTDIEALLTGAAGGDAPPSTLGAWAELVRERRRSGLQPPPHRGESAADLVLADRRLRDAGAPD